MQFSYFTDSQLLTECIRQMPQNDFVISVQQFYANSDTISSKQRDVLERLYEEYSEIEQLFEIVLCKTPDNKFIRSLEAQFQARGSLSPKQKAGAPSSRERG